MRINQKINFYSDEFRPPVIQLPTAKMVQYLGLSLGVLIAVALMLYYPIPTLDEEITALNTRLADKQAELKEAKRKYPKLVKSKALETQLAALREQNNNKIRLLNYLKSDTLKDAQAYSGVFEDLTQFDHRQVWLTRIDVLSEGQSMRLTGLVSQPDVLPGYIDGLKQAASFKGRAFNLFNLERDEDNKNYLHFILSTDINTQKKAGGPNSEG
ncbi:hypothetical protein [Litoribrevibacter albus]|uniref:Uncharacterized protein n=1 Tax=Litoribrevibacter albus TaxID=1473156 RepID=A0AA37SC53_9GAMM|nr:hypothetical protein [Litoribrevibacter albus]GLQ33517.1 hypothetical protein GCM10007876_39970 [Litoribrevibacter albus]